MSKVNYICSHDMQGPEISRAVAGLRGVLAALQRKVWGPQCSGRNRIDFISKLLKGKTKAKCHWLSPLTHPPPRWWNCN